MVEASPLVTAVIPVYNGEKHLAETVESALGQSHSNMEVVVVDDGSTDDSARVIASFGSRIRAFSQRNGGVAAARNRAIAEARGAYVAMLDQDDVWLPHKTEVQLKAFNESPAVVLVWSGCQTSDERAAGIPNAPAYHAERLSYSATDLLVSDKIPCLTAMARRDAVLRVGGFDENAPPCDDWDLWIRLSQVGKLKDVADTLGVWRVHADQTSKNRGAMSRGEAYVVRKNKACFLSHSGGRKLYRQELSRRLAAASLESVKEGNQAMARRFALAGIVQASGEARMTCAKVLIETWLGTKRYDALSRRLVRAGRQDS